jgi:hypothetical protein
LLIGKSFLAYHSPTRKATIKAAVIFHCGFSFDGSLLMRAAPSYFGAAWQSHIDAP